MHLLPHIFKAGGIPAALGAVVAAALSWPTSHLTLQHGVFVTTYHSGLHGSTLSQSDALLAMIGCVIGGALIGLAVGFFLVVTGIVPAKELGMEE